jgi:DNA repair protein RadC
MRVYEASIKYHLVSSLPAARILNRPDLVAEYMRDAFEQNPTQESIWVIAVNRRNKPIARSMVSLGTSTSSLVSPSDVFRYLILQNTATGYILAHNHPSGDPSPSVADISITRQLREASILMQLTFLDHVVCGDVSEDPLHLGFYSFRNAGLL